MSITSVTPALGSVNGGYRISISGNGLGTVTTANVTVGGRPCTEIVVAMNGDVSCEVPPGVGSRVAVLLTTASGVVAGGQGFFRYFPPIFSSIEPRVVISGDLLMDFIIRGSNLGTFRDTPSVQVGGIDCGIVNLVNSTFMRCLQLRTTKRAEMNGDTVSIEHGADLLEVPGAIRIIGRPVVRAVSPASIPSVGNIRVTVSGENFGAVESHI